MKCSYKYPVLERAREIAQNPELDILEIRKFLGVPIANDIRRWLQEQPPHQLLCIDFKGVRAITGSVAQELGPVLMQYVQQIPELDQRYPIFCLYNPEHAYTFAMAFANSNWTGLAMVEVPLEPNASMFRVAKEELDVIVVLGQLSKQMEQILTLAERRAKEGQQITSENLIELDFLSEVSPGARSKRLTELYTRRLLAFDENPRNPKERLFIPVWRL
jgi:hypothetical protein